MERIGLIGDISDFTLLEGLFAGECVIERVDPSRAEGLLRDRSLTLIVIALLDARLDALDDIALLGADTIHYPLPVLALVPRGDAGALTAAFERGVADCAYHPIDGNEVLARVRALLRRKANIDRLRAEAEEARRLAHIDPVTGLWNRHYLDAELASALVRARAKSLPLSALMIDIDRFKPINDRHGHAAGDHVLREVGVRLTSNLRGVDTVARIGGDELAVVMPDVGRDVALAVAERLRALIAETAVTVQLSITVSIGVAEFADHDDPAALLGRADAALYAAKLAGRNCVVEAAAGLPPAAPRPGVNGWSGEIAT